MTSLLPLANQTGAGISGRGQRGEITVSLVVGVVGWAPGSFPILPETHHCTPRLTTTPTKHPRCLGIQPVSHTNLQAGECRSTYWKETNKVAFLNASASKMTQAVCGDLTLRMQPHGAQIRVRSDSQASLPYRGA